MDFLPRANFTFFSNILSQIGTKVGILQRFVLKIVHFNAKNLTLIGFWLQSSNQGHDGFSSTCQFRSFASLLSQIGTKVGILQGLLPERVIFQEIKSTSARLRLPLRKLKWCLPLIGETLFNGENPKRYLLLGTNVFWREGLQKSKISTWMGSLDDPNQSSTTKSHYGAKLPAKSAILCRAKCRGKH